MQIKTAMLYFYILIRITIKKIKPRVVGDNIQNLKPKGNFSTSAKNDFPELNRGLTQ